MDCTKEEDMAGMKFYLFRYIKIHIHIHFHLCPENYCKMNISKANLKQVLFQIKLFFIIKNK